MDAVPIMQVAHLAHFIRAEYHQCFQQQTSDHIQLVETGNLLTVVGHVHEINTFTVQIQPIFPNAVRAHSLCSAVDYSLCMYWSQAALRRTIQRHVKLILELSRVQQKAAEGIFISQPQVV